MMSKHIWMTAVCFGIASIMAAEAVGAEIAQWTRFEALFYSRVNYENPPQDANLTVLFHSPDGSVHEQPGFWDGGVFWRVRFSPDVVGRWTYETRSSNEEDGGLHGLIGWFDCVPYEGDNPFYKQGALRLAESRHHFEHADGTPWFWLADTVWNGALRSDLPSWERFLDKRVEQNFNAIQFVTTQWRAARADALGQTAFEGENPIRINPEFYQRMDAYFDAVNERGLLAVPVLLWALPGQGNPGHELSVDDRIALARYQIARYGAHQVAWFLGGDGNYMGDNAQDWKRIGRAVLGDNHHRMATLHPWGMNWIGEEYRNEPWFTFIGYQSGHGDHGPTLRWAHSGPASQNWNNEPHLPVLDLEPCYEDHIAYQSRERHTDFTVRRVSYWSLLVSPTTGVTYGGHGVWGWHHEYGLPVDHGGTGEGQPWYIAMSLPGAYQMGFLRECFASMNWWDLRPDREMVKRERERNARAVTDLTHVVYTRDADHNAAIYINGEHAVDGRVPGDFSNWNDSFRMALGNELSGDRPWLGEFHRVALYNRALTPEQIQANHEARQERSEDGLLALYLFNEGQGNVVRDHSGAGLDLTIENTDATRWLADGGLDVHASTRIASSQPPRALIQACQETNAITVEAWIKSHNESQDGPARIITLSRDSGERNFTLGQDGNSLVLRLRTTNTSVNGEPALATLGEENDFNFIAAARSESGDLAAIYTPTGGEFTVDTSTLDDGVQAKWFDPRTGEWSEAMAVSKPSQTFSTPTDQDWLLRIQKP